MCRGEVEVEAVMRDRFCRRFVAWRGVAWQKVKGVIAKRFGLGSGEVKEMRRRRERESGRWREDEDEGCERSDAARRVSRFGWCCLLLGRRLQWQKA